jgi:hypothetical protein
MKTSTNHKNRAYKFIKASKVMFGAYELRYWFVFAIIAQIGYVMDLLNTFGLILSLIAFGLGGYLAGLRLSKEGIEL